MTDTPIRAKSIVHAHDAPDHVALDYEGRLIRRKRLTSAAGRDFIVDLAEVTSLTSGDAFQLEDGSLVAVHPAPEAIVAVTGDLPRLAWHIGNRHTPCRIESDRLLIRADHVLEAMLTRLGAGLETLKAPFEPEGGAYGHGRTFGHSHGHDHGHDQDGHHTYSHD